MISQIPEDNWQDAVQIIGWLYQYYNSEKKDDVFAALKKNVKITKENIPAATQLFTPDWIVRYMVENSLGRLWVEGHPDAKAQLLPTPEEQAAYTVGNRDPEDTKWHYYLEEAQQEPQVQAQLAEIRKQYADLTPEQIKVIDLLRQRPYSGVSVRCTDADLRELRLHAPRCRDQHFAEQPLWSGY